MANKIKYETNFKIAFVPVPPDMVEARRASIRMLLEWILENIALHPNLPKKEEEKKVDYSAGED